MNVLYKFIGKPGQVYELKFNYKCEFNGTDNKCNLEQGTEDIIKGKYKERPSEKQISQANKQSISIFDKSSEEEIQAIDDLTAESDPINEYIYSNDKESDFDEHQIERIREKIFLIDNVMKKAKLPSDMTVFRGVSEKEFNIISKQGDKESFTMRGYKSTTIDQDVAEAFSESDTKGKNLFCKIHAPKGSEVLAITPEWSRSRGESEFLINRGTSYKINKIEETDSARIIDITILG